MYLEGEMSTMDYLFIAGVSNIEVSGNVSRKLSYRTNSDIIITNSQKVINEHIPAIPINIQGFMDELYKRKLFLIAEGALLHGNQITLHDGEDTFSLPEDPRTPKEQLCDFIYTLVNEMDCFIQSLWMTGDNACSLSYPICFYGNKQQPEYALELGPTRYYFSSNGDVERTSFDVKQINQACDIFDQHFSNRLLEYPMAQWIGYTDDENRVADSMYLTDVPKLYRFYNTLCYARSVPDAGLHLALLVSCLEILFATNTEALAKQLSERIAFFLASGPDERVELADLMKTAYSIRSSIIHGDVLSVKRMKKASSVWKKIDNIARRVLQKIYSHKDILALFYMSDKDFDAYFNNLQLRPEDFGIIASLADKQL